jgi:hypothetical protein
MCRKIRDICRVAGPVAATRLSEHTLRKLCILIDGILKGANGRCWSGIRAVAVRRSHQGACCARFSADFVFTIRSERQLLGQQGH